MEFEKYGPLAESKEMATNQKTSWVPLAVILGLGIIIGVAWINIVNENKYWNKVKRTDS